MPLARSRRRIDIVQEDHERAVYSALRRGALLAVLFLPTALVVAFVVGIWPRDFPAFGFGCALTGLAAVPFAWLGKRASAWEPSPRRTALVAAGSFALAYALAWLIPMQVAYAVGVYEGRGDVGAGLTAILEMPVFRWRDGMSFALQALLVLPAAPLGAARVARLGLGKQIGLVVLTALIPVVVVAIANVLKSDPYRSYVLGGVISHADGSWMLAKGTVTIWLVLLAGYEVAGEPKRMLARARRAAVRFRLALEQAAE